MQNKIIFAGLVILVFLLAAIAGYYGPPWLKDRQTRVAEENFVPGHVPDDVVKRFAEDFDDLSLASKPTYLPEGPFSDLKGGSHTMSDFRGMPALVNYWATWCLPCVVELPSLDRFQQAYEGRIRVMAIAVQPDKKPEDISRFLENRNTKNLAAYVDSTGQIMQNLGIRGVPTSFLIGSNGQILYRFEGDAHWDSADSRAFFDAFLLQNQ